MMRSFRPPIIFVAITFGVSWGLTLLLWVGIESGLLPAQNDRLRLYPFLLLSVWAPNIAAVAAAYVTEGCEGVWNLLRRLTRWHVGWFWWAAAFLLPFALWNLAILCAKFFADVSFARWIPSSSGALLTFVAMNVIAGPLGEELGWRGFALPRLLPRMGALPASLLIGAVWALWHVPVFFFPHVEGLMLAGVAFLPFVIYILSASVLMSWITLNARQSVLPAVAFHFMLLVALIAVDHDPLPALMWAGAACYAAAAIVVAVWSPDLGAGRTADGVLITADGSAPRRPAL